MRWCAHTVSGKVNPGCVNHQHAGRASVLSIEARPGCNSQTCRLGCLVLNSMLTALCIFYIIHCLPFLVACTCCCCLSPQNCCLQAQRLTRKCFTHICKLAQYGLSPHWLSSSLRSLSLTWSLSCRSFATSFRMVRPCQVSYYGLQVLWTHSSVTTRSICKITSRRLANFALDLVLYTFLRTAQCSTVRQLQ